MKAKTQDGDLVMFNKVMALSDFDICKFLSETEGLQTYIKSGSVRVVVLEGDDYNFDPLSNNDQFTRLLEKHDIERTWQPYDFLGWSYHVLNGANPLHILERQDYDEQGVPDISMQKASCLAILLNKSERFKFNQ